MATRLSADNRAALASQIINNALWPEIYKEMRLNLFQEFCNTLDEAEQKEIGTAMRVISRLEEQLNAFIAAGNPDERKPMKLVGDNRDGNAQ